MSRAVIAMHGRSHVPGGSDPIPNLPEAVTVRNYDTVHSIAGAEWKVAAQYDTGPGGITRTQDSTVPFGGYLELNGDGEYVVIGAPLGPRYSTWGVQICYRLSSDSGRVEFAWTTTPVDSDYGGSFAQVFSETVEGPEDYVGTTYYKGDSTLTHDQDLYSAGSSDVFNTQIFAPIRIDGAPGAMLSANGTATDPVDEPGDSQKMNGGGDGSVMWWLRVRVNGKNASSSGYKARLYYLAIVRVENSYSFRIT